MEEPDHDDDLDDNHDHDDLGDDREDDDKTSQELRMLSSVTIYCQITKIVMNSGSKLSEL